MKFVPYSELDGVPNIVVDGNKHKDSKLVLSHWIDSGTPKQWMRDTSAQIVLDYLKYNKIPDGINAVSNDHFDQDGLVGVFTLIDPNFAFSHYNFFIDIATSGDFGRYRDRNAARVSMSLAKMVHPDTGIISKEVFQKTYPEMAAVFYQKALVELPKMIQNINNYKELWEKEDSFLTKCENYFKNNIIKIEEDKKRDLAIVHIPIELPAEEFHRFAVFKNVAIHDMALHQVTNCGRILYVHGKNIQFRYRYETWVQLEKNIHPLRVSLEEVAKKLSEIDGSPWKYQGSHILVPTMDRVDKRETSVSLEIIITLLNQAFDNYEIDWDPYR